MSNRSSYVAVRAKKFKAATASKREARRSGCRAADFSMANERTMSSLVKRVMQRASEKKVFQVTSESRDIAYFVVTITTNYIIILIHRVHHISQFILRRRC